jgi:hypothetical protein
MLYNINMLFPKGGSYSNNMLLQNKNSNIKTPMTVCIWNNIIFVSENNNAESAPKSNIIRHFEELPVPMGIGKAISFY